MSNPRQGLFKGVRNPGSIVNAEFHDPSGSKKGASGVPATINQVIADSTVKTPLEAYSMLWVVNRDTVTQYLFVGKDSAVPGTVSASNGLALPAGEGHLFHCGASDDDTQSMAVKSSSSQVHITVLEV